MKEYFQIVLIVTKTFLLGAAIVGSIFASAVLIAWNTWVGIIVSIAIGIFGLSALIKFTG